MAAAAWVTVLRRSLPKAKLGPLLLSMFLSLHGQFSSEKDDEFVKLIETQSPGLKTQKRKNGYLA